MKEELLFVQPTERHGVEWFLSRGAEIRYIEAKETTAFFPSTANPSIVYDKDNDCFWLSIRKVSYFMHHGISAERNPGAHWGSLIYMIPDTSGLTLGTENYIVKVKDPMKDEINYTHIENPPHKPQWQFVHPEDIRLSIWDKKLYASPVVRDDNTTGIGRIHLMNINEEGKLLSDTKLTSPTNQYCEKNWCPVEDMSRTYIRTINPMNVVYVHKNGQTESIINYDKIEHLPDENFDMFRGSTQAVPFKDGYLVLAHTCQLFTSNNNRKSARYLHCFIYMDKNFNIIKTSELFRFNDMPVEFATGMTRKDNDFYITFSLQDNVSFILKTSGDILNEFICNYTETRKECKRCTTDVARMFNKDVSKEENFVFASKLRNQGDYAGAYTFFSRGVDKFDNNYNERFMMARCIADLGKREFIERNSWARVIEEDPSRPEGWMALAMYYNCRGENALATLCGKECMKRLNNYRGIYYSKEAIDTLWKKILYQDRDGGDTSNKVF